MVEEGLKVMLLSKDAGVPEKAYFGDAGFDLFAPEQVIIAPFTRKRIGLQIAIEFMPHYMGLIQEKSGLANLTGVFTIGNIIDSGYRGEIHVIIVNNSSNKVVIKQGQKIAQLVLVSCYTGAVVKVVDALSNSERSTGGFGSTGEYGKGVINANITE